MSTTRPPMDGPAFILEDGRPLTAKAFINTLRLALTTAGHPLPASITTDSIRRGGAQACAMSGSNLSAIKELGSWRSDAVHVYIPKHFIDLAPKSLSKMFG